MSDMDNEQSTQEGLMTFGEHLEVLRKVLFRIIGVTVVLGVAVFCFKDEVFELLFAPSHWDFATYRWLERMCRLVDPTFAFDEYHVQLISTELSAQFMMHITSSAVIGLLLASPYIVYELFRFVAPALYDRERRYAIRLLLIVYGLFFVGIVMSYFVVFPISFRFLGTYQVAADVTNQITLSSYISTFLTLTLLMGLVFQVPVIVYFLARTGLINVNVMRHYRRHAIMIIVVISAIITPPDILSLILVACPICLLYEVGVRIAGRVEKKSEKR